MIEVHITPTTRTYGPGKQWYRGTDVVERFRDMNEVRAFLKKRYGNCKRQPMYRDRTDGSVVKVGWVFGYRQDDGTDKWMQQDWVSFRECKDLTIEDL